MFSQRRSRSVLLLILIVVLGAFLGDILGRILAPYIPGLGTYASLGFDTIHISLLDLLDLTFGLSLKVNAMGALLALLGIFLWRR